MRLKPEFEKQIRTHVEWMIIHSQANSIYIPLLNEYETMLGEIEALRGEVTSWKEAYDEMKIMMFEAVNRK